MANSIQPQIARFEDFEVHLETGEVRKAGRPIKVHDQPFKVPRCVAGTAETDRYPEELRLLIWPQKSFGDPGPG